MHSKTYGRNGATPIFRSFHRTTSSPTGGWNHWNTLMCFLYIILSTIVSISEDAILFLQGLLFFIVCTFTFFASTLCMCVMCLTDYFDDRRSQCRLHLNSNDCAVPTDTNPKNLELTPLQSIIDMGHQVRPVSLYYYYNQNCYIQIFQTTFFTRSEDQTPNHSKLKSPKIITPSKDTCHDLWLCQTHTLDKLKLLIIL